MDLNDVQILPVEEKLQWLKSTEGLLKLKELLSEGNSLPTVAKLMSINSKTIYRWRDCYIEISDVVAPYSTAKAKATKDEPVNLARGLDYRIIYAYDDCGRHFKGCIMEEFDTLEKLWASIFVQQYFNSFGKSEHEYLSAYLNAMQIDGFFKLSNWYLLTYSYVTKKGLIKTHKSPV